MGIGCHRVHGDLRVSMTRRNLCWMIALFKAWKPPTNRKSMRMAAGCSCSFRPAAKSSGGWRTVLTERPSSFPSVNIPRCRSVPRGNAGMRPRRCSKMALIRRNTGRPRGHQPARPPFKPWLRNGTSGKPFTVKTAIAPSWCGGWRNISFPSSAARP